MKAKTNTLAFLKWVIVPLVVSGLLAYKFAPAYSQFVPPETIAARNSTASPAASTEVNARAITPSNRPTSINTTRAASLTANTWADTQEIKDRLKQLEDREHENYTLVLEGQRKTFDWWFSFLVVFTAILAIFGALIPFLMSRKDKELIEQMLREARETVQMIKGHETVASQTVEEIRHKRDEAKKLTENFTSDKAAGDVVVQKTKEAVATIQKDPRADFALKLRAEAIAASQAEKADKAYALWRALAELDPADASAQFNAGYWARDLGEKSRGDDVLHWLRQAGQHYQQALAVKPDKHEAANNWGNALDDEARALAPSDLAAARTLWQRAGEKYQQALAIKPDDESAHFNSACLSALLGQVQACCKSLAKWRKCKPEARRSELDSDSDFDQVRNTPEFQAFRESLPE